MVTAAGTLGSIAVAAARVPALMTLATAATARKRRRVGSRGGNIMGWSIADVFVRVVLSTLSAWVIWNCGPYWLGLEPGRKSQASPRLAFLVHEIHDQINITYQKIARAAGDRRGVGSPSGLARAIGGDRCLDWQAKGARLIAPGSHPPPR